MSRTTDFERMAKKYHRNHVSPRRSQKDVDPTKLGSELKEFFNEEAHEPEHEKENWPGDDGLAMKVASAVAPKVTAAASVGHEIGTRVAEGNISDEGESPAERGHEGGLIGGPKRDEVLTTEEKIKIAKKGGYARWGEAHSER